MAAASWKRLELGSPAEHCPATPSSHPNESDSGLRTVAEEIPVVSNHKVYGHLSESRKKPTWHQFGLKSSVHKNRKNSLVSMADVREPTNSSDKS